MPGLVPRERGRELHLGQRGVVFAFRGRFLGQVCFRGNRFQQAKQVFMEQKAEVQSFTGGFG